MASLFPMFLKLEGRRCVVVGGGEIARQKITGLLEAGADLLVVAPRANDAIREMADAGRLRWEQREFEARDLDSITLVISATADRSLNGSIFRLAADRGVLCNAVDEPEHCDFYYPSVVRRGDLQIAISTNGNSPALAQRLRVELESRFPPEYETWMRWLGRIRAGLFRRRMDAPKRTQLLHRAASHAAYERFVKRHSGRKQS